MTSRPRAGVRTPESSYWIYRGRPGVAEKNRARQKTQRAIDAGRLIRQPCEKCGASKTQAHHPDYSKALEVQWLCASCHKSVHRKTHCNHGHAMTDDNTYFNSKGDRNCRICWRATYRKANLKRSQLRPIKPERPQKTHCIHGHAMTANNTRINSKGTQCCIICARADDRKYKQRKRQQLTQQNGEIL